MYLMKGMAALAMGLVAASCNKMDFSGKAQISKEEALTNAELQLGATIDPNQDWKMTKEASASVTVNADYGETYTVRIYQNNPLIGNSGVLLAESEVKNGETCTCNFIIGKGQQQVFASYVDKKGYIYVKPVAITDGKVVAVFGEPATRGFNRTAANSNVNIPTCTITNEYVQSFLTDAKEPTDDNVKDNYDNRYWQEGTDRHYVVDQEAQITWPTLPDFNWTGTAAEIMYNYGSPSDEDKAWFESNCRSFVNWNWVYSPDEEKRQNQDAYIDLFWEVYNKLQNTGRANWMSVNTRPVKSQVVEAQGHWEEATPGHWVEDETYVKKFKIINTWNKLIDVLPTEKGYGDARTVYVSGKWTIPAGKEQRVGGGAVIVVVSGGEIVIPEGSQLNFVNQARLVVAGGSISGKGTINVTNGNNEGEEGYNSGTISVGKFNQNFGTFFNYGTFNGTELNGGAGTSTFVNHGHMYISGAPKGSNSANLQIKNDCWFEATGELACKLIENGAGSYIKAGSLDLSCSEGGEGIGTYIAADTNSKILITGAAKLNSTLIIGPTSGDAAYIEFDNINFLNVGETYPISNNLNLYVGSFTGANPTGFENSWNTNLNASGNGNAQMVGKAAFNTAATEASDCAPEFVPGPPVIIIDENPIYSYAFEDTENGDYDMNDVVLKVQENDDNIDVWLVAAGATLDLTINLYKYDASNASGNFYGDFVRTLELDGKTEIHKMWGIDAGTMVNTGAGANKSPILIAQLPKSEYEADKLRFSIVSSAWEVKLAGSGEAPYGVVIPMDWKWPKERVRITSAYNKTNAPETEADQSFSNFMSNAGHAELWYNYPTGSVMIKEFDK